MLSTPLSARHPLRVLEPNHFPKSKSIQLSFVPFDKLELRINREGPALGAALGLSLLIQKSRTMSTFAFNLARAREPHEGLRQERTGYGLFVPVRTPLHPWSPASPLRFRTLGLGSPGEKKERTKAGCPIHDSITVMGGVRPASYQGLFQNDVTPPHPRKTRPQPSNQTK